jgi:c-di-GMP-binding flagellar brake protein YcgR
MAKERRKYPRVAVQSVFSYICLDEDGHPIDEGMGTTVDISQGGIMIETSRPIESETLLLVSVDKDKKMLEIKGKVVYTRAIGPSKHLSGIEFIGSREEVMKIVKNLIIEFHSRTSPIR